MRVYFPLIEKGQDGFPPIQEPIHLYYNGEPFSCLRGQVVEAPDWVPLVCVNAKGYECFVSSETPSPLKKEITR